MGKAFEKQIKTIEDQVGKQIKAIQDKGRVKTIKKYDHDDKDIPLILKQKEIFNELADERRKEIIDLNKNANRNDLVYRCKGNSPDERFDKYDNAIDLFNKILDGEIKLSDAKNDQIKFKSHLSEIKKGNNKKRSKEQKNTLYNIEIFDKSRNEVIKFYDDYSLMASEAKK